MFLLTVALLVWDLFFLIAALFLCIFFLFLSLTKLLPGCLMGGVLFYCLRCMVMGNIPSACSFYRVFARCLFWGI